MKPSHASISRRIAGAAAAGVASLTLVAVPAFGLIGHAQLQATVDPVQLAKDTISSTIAPVKDTARNECEYYPNECGGGGGDCEVPRSPDDHCTLMRPSD